MNKGDIVLIPFPFTNLKETKKRPAVVLYTNKQDVIVAFITSRLKWSNSFDVSLIPNSDNHLKKESLIRTDKIATVDCSLIIGKIGILSDDENLQLNMKLKLLLKL